MKPLIVGVFLAPVLVAAQSPDNGTVNVYFQQISAAGQLEGCSLVFTALEADYVYLRGQQIVVNGSIAIQTLSGDLLLTGKLGTRRFLDLGKWEAPEYFYFASANGTTAGKAKVMAAETAGYKLLLSRATEEPILGFVKDLVSAQEFTVGFNRVPQGQDVYTTIKMNVALKRDAAGNAQRVESNDTAQSFLSCVSKLTTSLGGK